MSPPEEPHPERGIESFLDETKLDLAEWHWLWAGDHELPVRSRGGVSGKLILALKRLLRPVVKAPQGDLWDRQRIFNLILVHYLQVGEVRHRELLVEVARLATSLEKLEGFRVEGVGDLVKHHDSLFALLDQKLDSYRRENRELLRRLEELAGSGDRDEGP